VPTQRPTPKTPRIKLPAAKVVRQTKNSPRGKKSQKKTESHARFGRDCRLKLTMPDETYVYFVDRLIEIMGAGFYPRTEWETGLKKLEWRSCIDGDYGAQLLDGGYFRIPALAGIIDYYYTHPDRPPTAEELVTQFKINEPRNSTFRLPDFLVRVGEAKFDEERKLLASSFIRALNATRIWEHQTNPTALCGPVDGEWVKVPPNWQELPTLATRQVAVLLGLESSKPVRDRLKAGKLSPAAKGRIVTSSVTEHLHLQNKDKIQSAS